MNPYPAETADESAETGGPDGSPVFSGRKQIWSRIHSEEAGNE